MSGFLCDNLNDMKCQTLPNQFSSSLIRSTQPVILAIHISHAWTDLFLMVVIIIKWSVITADNPHMQSGILVLLGGSCLLMYQWNLKHIQMCVGQTTNSTQIPAIVLVRVCTYILPSYGHFSPNVQLFGTEPPYSTYFPPPRLHGWTGQTVLVWWWWFGPRGSVTSLWGR